MANKYCNKCDTRKMARSSKGDKVQKGIDGKPVLEFLGYVYKKCGAKWRQRIDYTKSGRKVTSWIRVLDS